MEQCALHRRGCAGTGRSQPHHAEYCRHQAFEYEAQTNIQKFNEDESVNTCPIICKNKKRCTKRIENETGVCKMHFNAKHSKNKPKRMHLELARLLPQRQAKCSNASAGPSNASAGPSGAAPPRKPANQGVKAQRRTAGGESAEDEWQTPAATPTARDAVPAETPGAPPTSLGGEGNATSLPEMERYRILEDAFAYKRRSGPSNASAGSSGAAPPRKPANQGVKAQRRTAGGESAEDEWQTPAATPTARDAVPAETPGAPPTSLGGEGNATSLPEMERYLIAEEAVNAHKGRSGCATWPEFWETIKENVVEPFSLQNRWREEVVPPLSAEVRDAITAFNRAYTAARNVDAPERQQRQ
ncbi:hypothetical protein CYMTET_29066 [Cymbomonas tetramitiformis]|uniref:Uncharacterized protein n=1 Tax=Cymbomonas tetramitiformis TaxID=36881 RepID=A0AAE0FLQ9_9CHLO|nr:hypothetical protein CYMTET_29066 [Cymbomonas tetramitiformis]